MHAPKLPIPNLAFAELCARRTEFIGFARPRVPAGTDPEDLVQQAFVLAIAKIAQLREGEKAVPWFYTILRRTLADAATANATRSDRLLGPLAECDELQPVGTTEMCDCGLRLAGTLPPQYAEVLSRIDMDGEEPADVAKSLGTTTGNIAVRIHRARQALKLAFGPSVEPPP